MDKQIYFIRHGETAYNKSGIVQGSGVDSSLNETGWSQAKAFFEHYQETGFEVVLTSTLQRSQQTVKGFIDKGIPVEHFAEINEINWGVHEGKKSNPHMVQQYRDLIAEWAKGNFDARLEEGESALELSTRVDAFLEHVKSRKEKMILVCSHGRTMRCIISRIKGLHLREMENCHHQNTGLYLVNYTNSAFVVELENVATHLK